MGRLSAARSVVLLALAGLLLVGCVPASREVAPPAVRSAGHPPAPSVTQNLDYALRAAREAPLTARQVAGRWRADCVVDRARAVVTCFATQVARSGERLRVIFSGGVLLVEVSGRNTASSILTMPVVRVDGGHPRPLDSLRTGAWAENSTFVVRDMLRGERVYSTRINYPFNNSLTGEYEAAGLREALLWMREEYARLHPQVRVRFN